MNDPNWDRQMELIRLQTDIQEMEVAIDNELEEMLEGDDE